MHVEHHSLIKDFPELRGALHQLRLSDADFTRLADTYEALDKRICRIETGGELLAGDALVLLKLERVSHQGSTGSAPQKDCRAVLRKD